MQKENSRQIEMDDHDPENMRAKEVGPTHKRQLLAKTELPACKKEPAVSGGSIFINAQIGALLASPAEALDALAGLLKQRFRSRVGDAEVGAEAEGRAMNDGNTFAFQQLRNEVFVGLDHLA